MRCPICRRRYEKAAGCPQHGRTSRERERESIEAPAIPGLAIGGLLGRGGFSTVWATEHAGRAAALKLGHRGTEAAHRRAAREAAALERLGGSHAPGLYARGEAAGRPYLVMARIGGATLEQQLEGGGVSGLRETGAAIAEAVAAVHAAGVVHGDLKPDNVALDDGGVVLIDLGSAVLDGAAAPLGASVEYMAPELWRGGAASCESDVYALGAILYELVAGQPPFVGEARTVEHHHLMLRPALAGFAGDVARLVGRCLAKDPAQRPTAAETGAAIRALGTAVHVAAAREAIDRGAARTCALVIADVRAEAPAVARIVERHGGEVLYVRGERVVAAWSGGQPAAQGVAAARELHRRHGARAVIGIERIACDPETQALRPTRANLAPAWAPRQWQGVIGTAPIAALLDTDAPGGYAELSIERSARDVVPLIGRDRELVEARASLARFDGAAGSRALAIVGAPGMGKSHFARQLVGELAARAPSWLSGREVSVEDAVAAAGQAAVQADEQTAGHVAAGQILVIDDAEAAPDAVLEALERRATAPGGRLWLVLTGRPALRGRLGRLLDAVPHDELELGPLDDAAAAALVEAALAVERIPEAVMRRLAALGEGRPRRLVELAAHLQHTGAVRRREGLDRRYVAADAVTLPDHGLDEWLAEAALAALPAELRAVTVAAALLEPGFELAELEAVIDRIPGAADPAVGLVELATRGIAIAEGPAWRLASTALVRAAQRTVAEPAPIAAAALAHGDRSWTGQLDERRRRALARYAAAAGDPARAARLLLALAEDGQRAHRDDEAEADFAAALELQPGLDEAGRGAALLGRGVVRYRLDRAPDAIADLREAARLGDPVRAHLELATALDWLGRYDESAQAWGEAVRLLGDAAPSPPPEIARTIAMSRGRSAVRTGRYQDARVHFERAIELEGPDPADDRLLARMLLGPALVHLRELAEAERVLVAALDDAERIGDGLARCAVLGNCVMLWSARGELERARADLEATCALARRHGNAVLERGTTLNFAEQLYWHGRLDEAAPLAERARELQRRLVGHALEDELLVARIVGARGDRAAAREALARAAEAATARGGWSIALRIQHDAVAAFVDRAPERFAALEAEARDHLVGDEHTEILAWWFAVDPDPALADRARALGVGLQAWRFVPSPTAQHP